MQSSQILGFAVLPDVTFCVNYLRIGKLDLFGIELNPIYIFALMAIGLMYSMFYRSG